VRRSGLALLAAAVVAVALGGRAQACSACGCGDPSLTLMGTDRPGAGTWRFSLESRTFEHVSGGTIEERVLQSRLTLGAAATPVRWLTLTGYLPTGYARLSETGLPAVTTVGVADAEVDARAYLWEDRHFAPTQVLSVVAGVKVPTGLTTRDQNGRVVSLDAQLGTGSWDPLAGATYRLERGRYLLYTSATLRWPTEGRSHLRAGRTVLVTVAPQTHLRDWLAVLLGVDVRASGADTLAGAPLPDTGGWIAYLSPTVLLQLHTDLLLRLSAQIPVLNQLWGNHSDSVVGLLGLTYGL
jgi:hypothetical protein